MTPRRPPDQSIRIPPNQSTVHPSRSTILQNQDTRHHSRSTRLQNQTTTPLSQNIVQLTNLNIKLQSPSLLNIVHLYLTTGPLNMKLLKLSTVPPNQSHLSPSVLIRNQSIRHQIQSIRLQRTVHPLLITQPPLSSTALLQSCPLHTSHH